MGSVNEIYSIEAANGIVLSQNPSSSTVVTRGALIDVNVFQRARSGRRAMPGFLGQAFESAQEWAKSANINVEIKEDLLAGGSPNTRHQTRTCCGPASGRRETLH